MRIRTIKPEFWQSSSIASIAKEHRLLAIALLNYADDDGYFEATPQVIRGALMPFDDDTADVSRGLAALAEIGYLEVGECSRNTPGTLRNHSRTIPGAFHERSRKIIARIVNFRAHQRIEKPQKSRLSCLEVAWGAGIDVFQAIPGTLQERSWNIHGILPERSVTIPGPFPEPSMNVPGGNGMEQGREEEQGSGKGKKELTLNSEVIEPLQNSAPPHKPARRSDHRAFTVGVDFKAQPSLSFFVQECNRAISPSWQGWALKRHYDAMDARGWKDAQGQAIGHWGLYMASVYDSVDDHWEFVEKQPIGSLGLGAGMLRADLA